MKHGRIVILGILLISLSALAQERINVQTPATREQVLTMMDAMQASKTVQAVMDSTRKQITNSIQQQFEKEFSNTSPKMRNEMMAALQDTLKEMEPIMAEITEDMVPVYQKYLTSQEAVAITNFYLSPEGQSYVNKLPLIMNESTSVITKTMQERMEPITQQLAKRLEEIAKKYAPQATNDTTASPKLKTGSKSGQHPTK